MLLEEATVGLNVLSLTAVRSLTSSSHPLPLGPAHRVLSSDWLLLGSTFEDSPAHFSALPVTPPRSRLPPWALYYQAHALNSPPTLSAPRGGPAPATPASARTASPTPLGPSQGPCPRRATPISWLLLLRTPRPPQTPTLTAAPPPLAPPTHRSCSCRGLAPSTWAEPARDPGVGAGGGGCGAGVAAVCGLQRLRGRTPVREA